MPERLLQLDDICSTSHAANTANVFIYEKSIISPQNIQLFPVKVQKVDDPHLRTFSRSSIGIFQVGNVFAG
jgi:hypothetical protein